ncbi:MAG: hypothetical protein D6788_02355 [Planctomycetota bacterium]|nr:MAG: hypothetical protein D6788_02355 [Planctomycetota bacterium]
MIGYAFAYGRQVLLARVGNRSTQGVKMLFRSLLAVSATLWVVVPLLERTIGTEASPVLLALLLLAVGGILIIHDPVYTARARRARLCMVFGSLALMIALTEYFPGWWSS